MKRDIELVKVVTWKPREFLNLLWMIPVSGVAAIVLAAGLWFLGEGLYLFLRWIALNDAGVTAYFWLWLLVSLSLSGIAVYEVWGKVDRRVTWRQVKR